MIFKFAKSIDLYDADRFYYGWRAEAESGIIQFYSPEQIIQTAVPRFSEYKDLALVEINEVEYGKWVQWQSINPDGELFPQLHCPMDMKSIVSCIGLFDDDESRILFLRDYIFENPDRYPRRTEKWPA